MNHLQSAKFFFTDTIQQWIAIKSSANQSVSKHNCRRFAVMFTNSTKIPYMIKTRADNRRDVFTERDIRIKYDTQVSNRVGRWDLISKNVFGEYIRKFESLRFISKNNKLRFFLDSIFNFNLFVPIQFWTTLKHSCHSDIDEALLSESNWYVHLSIISIE